MDSARWDRVQGLFHAALDLPPASRATFLAGVCGPDDELCRDVTALLDADAAAAPALVDGDLSSIAQAVLDGSTTVHRGSAVGRYTLIRCLGEGGMGVVHLAERRDIGGRVAIKLLRDAWVSPARRERFVAEQRMLAQLTHPGIAQLFDADTLANGTPWFAMEYVEGEPLTEYCRQRRLPIRDRLRLFRQVCEAVLHAHQQLIVHRDLKPSNILVSADGRVKLLDFGIAKHLTPVESGEERTRTVLRLMTPAYAAPEQIRGEAVTVQTDVYSLGVVLYELLTDRRPFDLDDRTPAEAEALLTGSEPRKPSLAADRRRGVTAWRDLDVLCLTAMQREPARRYATVDALLRDVDHYLADRPLDARAGALIRYRAGKFARRHWRSVAAAIVVLATIATLVVFYTSRLTAARNNALTEADRTRRIQQFMLSLFQSDEQGTAPAEDLRVVSLLDRGVREAGSLDADPLLQAELRHTLGTIFQQLGRDDRAESLLGQAVDARRRVLGDGSREVAESRLALGLVKLDESQLDAAEALVRQARDRLAVVAAAADPVQGRAAAALGRIYRERGEYDEAATLLEEAIGIFQPVPGNEKDLAQAMTSLANTRFYAGRLDESEALNRQVLAIDRRLYGDRHPDIGHDLINLGNIAENRGQYEAAISQYRQALAILQAWFGTDHPETASAMTVLAQPLTATGHYDESAALLEQALATQERVYGPTHARVAFALNALGGVELRRGHLDAAEHDYRRALEIYAAVNGPRHVWVGVATANLGGVATARGDYGTAEALLTRALEIYNGQLAADHVNVGVARVKLGRALLLDRRYADAERQLTSGYAIVSRRNPASPWLANARDDLVTLYDALHQPDKAAPYRSRHGPS